MATAIQWTARDQSRVNSLCQTAIRFLARRIGIVAVALLVGLLFARVEYHRGTFGGDFNQDFDVTTLNLKLALGFELRAGGGSVNLVNVRRGIGKVLFRLPS